MSGATRFTYPTWRRVSHCPIGGLSCIVIIIMTHIYCHISAEIFMLRVATAFHLAPPSGLLVALSVFFWSFFQWKRCVCYVVRRYGQTRHYRSNSQMPKTAYFSQKVKILAKKKTARRYRPTWNINRKIYDLSRFSQNYSIKLYATSKFTRH